MELLRQENLQLRQQANERPNFPEKSTEPIPDDEQSERLEQKYSQVLSRKQMAKFMGVSERTLDKTIAASKKISNPPVVEFEGKKWSYTKDANSNKKLFKLLEN